MKKNNNIFVFVTCGEKTHINTLNFSLKYLQNFSRNEIIVITDSKRNEIEINYNNIFDINTPQELDNHQASIWLKTSLHNILPKGPLYCYLDSDVIAVNKNCDNVFNYYKTPITFAADHCGMQTFSPYALNCNCYTNFFKDKNDFESKVSEIVNSKNYPPDYTNSDYRNINKLIQEIKTNPFKNFIYALRILLCIVGINCKIKSNIVLNKKKKAFIIKENKYVTPFLFFYRHEITEKTNYKFNLLKLKWLKPNKEEFTKNWCNHLSIAIKNKFNITITETNWQHWNGGVFLFNESSNEFMETWHQYTLKIFEDSYWKTRDQGTLIATVWKYGLNNHPKLPQEFNFIADYYKWNISSKISNKKIEILINKTILTPNFIHVYHEFGNKNWELWRNIEDIYSLETNKNNITNNNIIVNGLWIGNFLSKLELLTINSFINNGHTFYLWTYNSLLNALPKNVIIKDANEIIPEHLVFRYKNKNQFGHGKGSLAGFSDIFRYKLLYEHGGWWTDMDVTCLKPLNFSNPYVFRTHHELKIVGNIMKCPKHSNLMKNCFEKATLEINSDNKDWHKPIKILVDEIKQQHLENYIVEISNQDSWALVRKLLTKKIQTPNNWYVIHWINEEWKRNKIRKDYFLKNTVYGKLMYKNQIKSSSINLYQTICYKINLSYFVAAIRQLPSFIKRKIN